MWVQEEEEEENMDKMFLDVVFYLVHSLVLPGSLLPNH